jgi:DNA repair exonuclease SbcCD ATPase subunit
VTVHRSQGSTVQRAHALEDGGGRELAYVKMSRAKDRSTVYVVADDVEQAREDLVREWSAERRPAWVIDSGTPATDPAAVEASRRVARPMRDALRRGRLAAERAAIAAVIPPDPSAEIRTVDKDLRRIHRQRQDLAAGTGRYVDGPIGHALWEVGQAEMNIARLKRDLDRSDASRRDRRRSRAELGEWQERHREVSRAVAATAAPEAGSLGAEEDRLTGRLPELKEQQANHRDWVAKHPEAARRLENFAAEIEALDARQQRGRDVPTRGMGLKRPGSWTPPPVTRERDLGIDLGL